MMLELVADGLSFPTSLTFDRAGKAHIAESGLPFDGAPPGGRVWRLDSAELHRPIDIRFGPSGALYALDFGYFEIDAERGLIARKQTGTLWRCQMPTKEK